MDASTDWIKTTWEASKAWWREHDHNPTTAKPVREPAHGIVPIRALGASHRDRIAQHLLQLSPADRYLRFGYAAKDAQIQRYVEQIDFARDELFGVFNRRLVLIAVAHLALPASDEHRQCAEFGVSVLPRARGRGLGARLFERAVLHARNVGVRMVFIHALTENTAMLNIARKAGAVVQRDGAESEAYLTLPPAGFDTRMAELVGQQMAEVDYQLKKQAQQFWAFLAGLQQVRQNVQEGMQEGAQKGGQEEAQDGSHETAQQAPHPLAK